MIPTVIAAGRDGGTVIVTRSRNRTVINPGATMPASRGSKMKNPVRASSPRPMMNLIDSSKNLNLFGLG